jgi:hypothetical protein
MAQARGSITVITDSGKTVTIQGSDLDFEDVSTDERPMGTEVGHRAEYEDEDGEWSINVDVYEYPSGTYETHEVEPSGCRVSKDNLGFSF